MTCRSYSPFVFIWNLVNSHVGEIFKVLSWLCMMLLGPSGHLFHDVAVPNNYFSIEVLDVFNFEVEIVKLCLSFFED